jgi:hypothetical protein
MWYVCLLSGSPSQINEIFNAGLVRPLLELLRENNPVEVIREACWAIANLSMGSPENIKRLVFYGAVEVCVERMIVLWEERQRAWFILFLIV